MRFLVPLLATPLFVVGCAGMTSSPSTAPSTESTSERPTPSTPLTPSGRRWTAGQGVEGCTLQGTVADCEATFGTPMVDKLRGFVTFESAGVELKMEGDKISTLFVLYRSLKNTPYVGTDGTGIGDNAQIEDVEKVYGKPTSSGGERDGKYWFTYDQAGVGFNFEDGELKNVLIQAPK